MSIIKKRSSDGASPSIEGGKGWVSFIKILLAVLTAIAGTLGISAMT